MTKQFINIVEISNLHNILIEIKSLFSFKISNFINTNDFLKEIDNENSKTTNPIVICKRNNYPLVSSTKTNINSLILLDDKPIKIGLLIDKINILLIKKKYNFQSHLNIKNYVLNINSRVISNKDKELKLTEREIDIILFLNEKKNPQPVINLQNEVWKYSNALETHTVETHIYRLRKKIKGTFNDDDFILSLKEGYII
jgi:hypothetical protein|tara:strand:- start:1110 stop:1706 length:597 start_codon:yes stop_codon:yes gene_type:complete